MIKKDNIALLRKKMSEAGFSLEKQALILGQAKQETGDFKRLKEDLNYSAKGLLATFPSRFKKLGDAQKVVNGGTAKIAEAIYGKRADLGNTEEGDGDRYRGRGFVMITGRSNYGMVGKALYPDDPEIYINDPELLESPDEAAKASLAYLDLRAKDAKTAEDYTRALNPNLYKKWEQNNGDSEGLPAYEYFPASDKAEKDINRRAEASLTFDKQFKLQDISAITIDGDNGQQTRDAWDSRGYRSEPEIKAEKKYPNNAAGGLINEKFIRTEGNTASVSLANELLENELVNRSMFG